MAYMKMMDGSFMVCGVLPKDAELKTVGEKNSSKTSFSVKASEITKPDGQKEVKWTNCVAWHQTARDCAAFKKGDVVLAIGHMDQREYNGKIYRDLVVEFAVKSGGTVSAVAPSAPASAESSGTGNSGADVDLSGFEEILSDGDCPF